MVEEKNISKNATQSGSLPLRRHDKRNLSLLGMIILICGIIIGASITFLCFKDRIVWDRSRNASSIAGELQSKYDLTEQQAQQVQEIFTKRMEARQGLVEEMDQRMSAEREKLVIEMKEVLTPEQFSKWKEEFDAKKGKRSNSPRPRPRASERDR